ncbi:beta-ketoacyl synthase N-terminal-like domain-containing protein [Tamlana sp. 2_MG-2023]|uniref:beta-ketoacyl-[acyl-carrier-protein] synthase family protein n=1 Tax=unclassified Tamlana TaxID=2614803 RepID=UPI0026E3D711|nr:MULTISPECIES: beta-ketoacyl synthase N-terminal-like domain-containing protein [unclassified Tamlana]MDO6758593.1 beta-ketoacyl synthase N-terminal-like domain-containing protein [Tamlana sp. 2_MG-2023]MDO6789292.1 beta-ketoacyl synthase N-terminal-like domain-containing protein [Tamlana sp. 1_MG-2023]
MSTVHVSYNNIVSALGFSTDEVVKNIAAGHSGLKIVDDKRIFQESFCGALIDTEKLQTAFNKLSPIYQYTRLEQMMITSLSDVIKNSGIKLNERVGLIISSTKGNIDALGNDNYFDEHRAYLSKLGNQINTFFNFKNEAIVVSNACVSGILAVSIAKRYIDHGVYDHVFIASGDVVSRFTLSGFHSFQALSKAPCKPYDANRIGINIGEVAASALVTNSEQHLSEDSVIVLGEGTSNDANHISGPSRTGEGLYRSMQSAFKEAKISANEIDYVSAHGTATLFNDEMEAIAFNRMGLSKVPLNSLKGYFGHTLGASGLVETIVGMQSLKNQTVFKSAGFETSGVTQPLNVIEKTEEKKLQIFLKTASGFGGCNTAVIFKKSK